MFSILLVPQNQTGIAAEQVEVLPWLRARGTTMLLVLDASSLLATRSLHARRRRRHRHRLRHGSDSPELGRRPLSTTSTAPPPQPHRYHTTTSTLPRLTAGENKETQQ